MRFSTSGNLLICTTCGTQYEVDSSSNKTECRICETEVFTLSPDTLVVVGRLMKHHVWQDPRQFVPPMGQSFTTLAQMREDGYQNKFRQDAKDPQVWEIWTEPKFAIGQRACLLQTPAGNILWDLITYIDQKTVDRIQGLGGIQLIIISHPHFYTTWADWSATFECPVYMSEMDSVWANRTAEPGAELKQLADTHSPILPGSDATAIICGGHFPGSMVLHWDSKLFIADTLLTAASARNPDPAKQGVASYSFMWSVPNWIPLPPDEIMKIWKAIKPYDFSTTYGILGPHATTVREEKHHKLSMKERVLQSAKIACKAMGYDEHEMLQESIS